MNRTRIIEAFRFQQIKLESSKRSVSKRRHANIHVKDFRIATVGVRLLKSNFDVHRVLRGWDEFYHELKNAGEIGVQSYEVAAFRGDVFAGSALETTVF